MVRRTGPKEERREPARKKEAADAAWKGAIQAGLARDIERVETAIESIDFEEEAKRFDWPLQVRRWLWHDKRLKGLAAYCRTFAVKRALEIGTGTGASAVCLAKYAGSVLTCDVTDWSVADPAIFTSTLVFMRCERATDALKLDYRGFDVLCVAFDHSGTAERSIHSRLLADSYRGDAFYDDIAINEEMASFWGSVKEPKLELDWHDAGFGVVRYRGSLKQSSTA